VRARDSRGRFVKLHPSALTAAASVLPEKAIDRMPRSAEAWQSRAWRLWRILGVLYFPTSAKAKQVGRLLWNVNVNGNQLEPEAAEEAIKAITAPITPAEASRRLALNLEVAGQVWYARAADEWNVYAATTPKLTELLKAADIRIEGLNPDPENPKKPTSAIQAALGTADQIRLMAAMSRNQDRNRLAQRGILLVPKEGQFPEGDPFQANLEASMTAPIADEYSPSAVVPLKVDYPAEYIEKWRHLVIESPYDDKLMERIEASIRQLALEIDMAPEVLLGNMDSNHWNAWLSSKENYRAFVEPLGVMVGEVYAEAMMQAVPDSGLITVTPDPGDMLSESPAITDVFEGFRLGIVGSDFARRHLGADDDDKPTPEDIELLLLLTGKAATEPEPEEPEAPVQEAPEMPDASPNGNGSPIAAAVDDQTDEALDELGRALVAIDIGLLGQLKGAAAMAVEAARERHSSDEVGAQDAVATEMERLGRAWDRQITEANRSLNALGVESVGDDWILAADASIALLVDGMTAYVTENLDKSDPEMPALPVLLLRQVIATAGGSGQTVVAALPNPTFQDPQGFAVGVLALKGLKGQGLELVQWRFRYGPLHRTDPFLEHKAQDGKYADKEGEVNGWHPGDHKGCECFLDPVFRKVKRPKPVREEVR
jgi:hypothetical protein